MTENDWRQSRDASEFLIDKSPISDKLSPASDRKLLLFGCACCYRHWHLFTSVACRQAVFAAESRADRLCTSDELRSVRLRVEAEHPNLFWTAEFGTFIEKASYYTAADSAGADEEQINHPLPDDLGYLRYL